ncbi:MAG: LysM peptidoglycan-binding domain-containing protein [Desulfamplus sp.]|nr:LysM peptidoglycan-binding domain-containing protein [Desulfamplus sp.]
MDNYNSLNEEKEPDDLLRENIIRRNKKKIAPGNELTGKSLLKKSDLSLVFIGAGIITLIVFFLFLRPSDNLSEDNDINEQESKSIEETVKTLEQKMTTLEEMLQTINASQTTMDGDPKKFETPDIKTYVARIERVETALSVKFDVLTARVDKMDDKLSNIIRDVEKNSRSVNNMKQTIAQAVQKEERETVKQPTVQSKTSSAQIVAPTKSETSTKPVETIKPAVATKIATKTAANTKSDTTAKTNAATQHKKDNQDKKGNEGDTVYHTVAKGDTLYGISNKYNTTVDQLRAMNKMTKDDAIIIGQRIVVKK